MPIYEYRCNDCDTIFEDLVMSKSAADSVACKHCGSSNVDRLMSGAAIKSHASHNCADKQDCPVKMGGTCCGGGHCHHV